MSDAGRSWAPRWRFGDPQLSGPVAAALVWTRDGEGHRFSLVTAREEDAPSDIALANAMLRVASQIHPDTAMRDAISGLLHHSPAVTDKAVQ